MKNVILKNGEELIVREAVIEDARSLSSFFKSIFQEDKYFITTPEDLKEDDYSVEKVEERISSCRDSERHLLLISLINDEIVGMLNLSSNDRIRMRHIGTIAMCISKEHREIGAGTVLMETVLDWAEKDEVLEKISLGVLADNHRAINLYKKFGFIEEGRKVKEIKRSENEYVDSILMYKFVK